MKDAIDSGYRHIDTAYLYGNEKEVGNAVRAKIAEGVIRREDVFITTKVIQLHVNVSFFSVFLLFIFLFSYGIHSINQSKLQ